MDPPKNFPFSDEELKAAGLLGKDASQFVQQTVETMKAHPELLNLSLFALECIEYAGQRMTATLSVPTASPTLSDASRPSTLTLASQGSDTIIFAAYTLSEYEKTSYYHGIAPNGDHPELLYRSDFATNPFPVPKGRFAHLPTKSVVGVHNTPLNEVWGTVGPQIRDLVNGRKVRWSSIDPARFITFGDNDVKTLSPVVIWIGVFPGLTSADTAHEVSQDVLALLRQNGVEDAVVEWREAIPSKLGGPALMRVVGNNNTTSHVRRIFTPALNVPLSTKEREEEDSQGSLTLYFHEGRDKHGNPSDRVLAVSNCHVLCKNTEVDYEFKGSGAPKRYVRVNGMHRFQQGLDDIRGSIGDHGMLADLYARDIVELEKRGNLDEEDEKELGKSRGKLVEEKEAIAELEAFYHEVKTQWSDIGLCNIGHLRYAKAITVDVEGGTRYTEDWGAFELDEAKFRPQFEGTMVDLGTAIPPEIVRAYFYPRGGGRTTFKYPEGRKLKIRGVVEKELLANLDLYDYEGQPCLIVGKDGTKTGLTFGRYAGLESFLCDELGVESIELGIYNWDKNSSVFSDKGDSGASIWDSGGNILGQLHSGQSKGGSTTSHVTYATPAWWLIQRIKLKFPHAVFFRETWSA